ncbi:sialidase family protein [Streptococcus ictaluri]
MNLVIYQKALSPKEVWEIWEYSLKQKNNTNEGAFISDEKILFESGLNHQPNKDGVYTYRIPALLKTQEGTLIAGADQRWEHFRDWGTIAMVVRRSEDKGESWQEIQTLVKLRDNPLAPKGKSHLDEYSDSPVNIDMVLVQDHLSKTKRIFSIYDMYPAGRGIFGMTDSPEQEYSQMDQKSYLNLYKVDQKDHKEKGIYTVRENGVVYAPDGQPTDYHVVIVSTQKNYSDLGDIYHGKKRIGNIYFTSYKSSPFRIAKSNYIWLSYSDDDGKSWSSPRDITANLRHPGIKFLGVGPGAGIVLRHGAYAGRIVVPAYSTNWLSHLESSQSSRVIYSDDHGESWQLGDAVNDNRLLENGETIHSTSMDKRHVFDQNTESAVVQLKNGDLKLFLRNTAKANCLQVATSKDGGKSFEKDLDIYGEVPEAYVQLSAVAFERDQKEYILLVNANGPGDLRQDGYARLAEVQADGSLKWLSHRLLQAGKFAYNCVQMIDDHHFGVLYEHSKGNQNDFNLIFKTFNWQYLTEGFTKQEQGKISFSQLSVKDFFFICQQLF